jgi:hypothetical protein
MSVPFHPPVKSLLCGLADERDTAGLCSLLTPPPPPELKKSINDLQ